MVFRGKSLRGRSLEEGVLDGSLWKSSHGMCGELDNACGDRNGEEEKDGKGYRRKCQEAELVKRG